MTRAELRSTLEAFRSMIRARGPREAMEVALVTPSPKRHDNAEDFVRVSYLYFRRVYVRAVLRWWRWAERNKRHPSSSVQPMELWS